MADIVHGSSEKLISSSPVNSQIDIEATGDMMQDPEEIDLHAQNFKESDALLVHPDVGFRRNGSFTNGSIGSATSAGWYSKP